LAVAGNKGPHDSSTAPPHTGVGRRMERKRQKLMGQVKGSLTDQQITGTVKKTILIRRMFKKISKSNRPALNAWCPSRSRAATDFSPPSSPHRNPP